MKKKLSKILGVGLTIALVASLVVIAAPVGADPAYTEIGASFGIRGDGDTAQWKTTQKHPSPETLTAMGVSSAWLDKAGGSTGPTYVQFTPPAGTTFSDFQAAITAGTPKWSFWHWLENTGVGYNGPQFELRFEDPNSTGWLEVTAVGLQGTAGTDAWLEEILAGTTLAGYGGWGEAGSGASFFNWGPLTPLSGILAAVNGEANVTSASDWVLERVRVELWEAQNRSCYIDDITIDGERYDLEQSYRIIPDIVAKDVKGTEQKFVILNLPMGMSDIEFLTYANPAQAMEDAQTDNVSLEVVAWEVIPGLEKTSVGPPGSGADIIITDGGGPTYTGGAYTGSANPQNWIKIWTRDPGDANVVVWLDEDLDVDSGAVLGVPGVDIDGNTENDEDIRLISEKKWGDIDHTILDLDPATAIVVDPVTKQIIWGQETLVHYVAGTVAEPEYELVDDWIYAWFYKSPVPSTFIDSVGHAVVHWWLIVDDALGLNEAAIDAIMADLSFDGCGTYADWPGAWGTPFSRIDAVATANPSTKFTFSAVTEGTLWPDPNVDGTFNNDADLNGVIDLPLDTYIKTMTEDDLLGETRGLVQVQLRNTGQEDVLIVTLTEYPWPYAGENAVAIEKGKKSPPPPGAVVVSIDAPAEVDPDSDFTAEVDIVNVEDFDSALYDIVFDDTVLRLDDITDGTIDGTTIPVGAWNLVDGRVTIVQNVPGAPGVTGDGTLAVLHFHVIGDVGDESAIAFQNGVLGDWMANVIAADWVDGAVTVAGVPPPSEVGVVAAPINVTADGSSTSTITATVNDQYGHPVVDGTDVVFNTDRGTLGSDTITKTTSGGVATATLTSESSTETIIATVIATANGASGATAVFFIPEGGAQVEESKTEIVTDSDTITDTPTGGDVSIDATGDHTITIAKYETNPAGIPTFEATGDYYDVHLDDDTDVNSLTIEFCPAAPDTVIYYWDGTDWGPASNQSYSDGCIVVTITDSTFPSLSDLTGLVFGSGTPPPPPPPPPPIAVGGEAYPISKLAILAPWIGLAMLLIGSITWFSLRRRRA